MKLIEREPHDDRCSASGCRDDYSVCYVEGASVLNRKTRVQLCDRHLSEFCAELDALEGTPPGREEDFRRTLRDLVRSVVRRVPRDPTWPG